MEYTYCDIGLICQNCDSVLELEVLYQNVRQAFFEFPECFDEALNLNVISGVFIYRKYQLTKEKKK